MILYEHPLNERVRTYLRAEYLLKRFEELLARDTQTDHHFALLTLFEIIEVGGRTDLKSEMLKEIDRYKVQLNFYRNNPSVSQDTLNKLFDELDHVYQLVSQQSARLGQILTDTEWISSLKNRANIPGGTCSFDLPVYHTWQQRPARQRREDIQLWAKPIDALKACTHLLLRLLREGNTPQRVNALKGQYQQNLPQGRYQLMRLTIAGDLHVVPEISGNRMMAWVRFHRLLPDGRMESCHDDIEFDVGLCG